MSAIKKLGRPPAGEERGHSLPTITFRVDAEVQVALEQLEAALGDRGVRNKRSIVIRQAILEAGARLSEKPKKR